MSTYFVSLLQKILGMNRKSAEKMKLFLVNSFEGNSQIIYFIFFVMAQLQIRNVTL